MRLRAHPKKEIMQNIESGRSPSVGVALRLIEDEGIAQLHLVDEEAIAGAVFAPFHVRIAAYPSHHPLLLGFETREDNMHADASRSESRSRHVSSDVGTHLHAP